VRYRNKKGRRPKRYKRSRPNRRPIRCSWHFTRDRACKNPGQWFVWPVLKASARPPKPRASCRYHIVNIFNRFRKEHKRFIVERVPDWKSVGKVEEELEG